MSKEFAGPHGATKVTPRVWAHENGIIERMHGMVGICVGPRIGRELKKWGGVGLVPLVIRNNRYPTVGTCNF